AHSPLPDPRRRRRDPQRLVVTGVRPGAAQGTDRHPDRRARSVAGRGRRARALHPAEVRRGTRRFGPGRGADHPVRGL
ncbi:MAG: Excisionase/Xis, DNA-binding, partial [uncultured Blastococcus sp.]